ncbi:MAG: hypothetical protein QXQ29_02315, partial [Candidatus Bathyarchaeia archaeon]
MGDTSIPQGSTAILDRVEGNLYVADDAVVKAKDSKAITVLGTIHCKGDCIFDCSVSATSLKGSDGRVTVRGDLVIGRSVRIDDGSLSVE